MARSAFWSLLQLAAAILCIGALVALSVRDARAADTVLADISGAELAAILQEQGFTAQVTTDEWGDPVINAAYAGLNFQVWTHECSGAPKRCKLIDFSAGFRPAGGASLEELDAFNETYVIGKTYLGDDGTAYVDFPVNLSRGVTRGNVIDNTRRWRDLLRAFADYIGWTGS